MCVRVCVGACVCLSTCLLLLSLHPDITYVVDRALETNYPSVSLSYTPYTSTPPLHPLHPCPSLGLKHTVLCDVYMSRWCPQTKQNWCTRLSWKRVCPPCWSCLKVKKRGFPSSLPLLGVGGGGRKGVQGGGCWHELGVTCRRTEQDICTCNHLTQLPCTEYPVIQGPVFCQQGYTVATEDNEATEVWEGIQYWTKKGWSQRGYTGLNKERLKPERVYCTEQRKAEAREGIQYWQRMAEAREGIQYWTEDGWSQRGYTVLNREWLKPERVSRTEQRMAEAGEYPLSTVLNREWLKPERVGYTVLNREWLKPERVGYTVLNREWLKPERVGYTVLNREWLKPERVGYTVLNREWLKPERVGYTVLNREWLKPERVGYTVLNREWLKPERVGYTVLNREWLKPERVGYTVLNREWLKPEKSILNTQKNKLFVLFFHVIFSSQACLISMSEMLVQFSQAANRAATEQ